MFGHSSMPSAANQRRIVAQGTTTTTGSTRTASPCMSLAHCRRALQGILAHCLMRRLTYKEEPEGRAARSRRTRWSLRSPSAVWARVAMMHRVYTLSGHGTHGRLGFPSGASTSLTMSTSPRLWRRGPQRCGVGSVLRLSPSASSCCSIAAPSSGGMRPEATATWRRRATLRRPRCGCEEVVTE